MNFKPVDPKANFSELEKNVQEFWKTHKIFEQSIKNRSKNKVFSFYDGPPFATGLPHYGTLLHSVTKDIVPRYWTMRGYQVIRRWGWDCHGLPIENLIEKELGIKTKKDIEKMGVAKFNETCRSAVMRCASDWEHYIEKLGRWADFTKAYKTMDPEYMESIWWIFKQLWEKDLIYEGKKSMHVCPRCSTSLSNFEVTLGYQEDLDPSAVVKIPLSEEKNTFFLVWTTTPWTLPANLLLAVHKDIEYQIIQIGSEEKYILAKERIPFVIGDQNYKLLKTLKGKFLEGKKYQTLFEKKLSPGKAYEVVTADFVSIAEGTGIVHIAPAYGEDDLMLGQKEGAPFYQHLNSDGLVNEQFPLWEGLSVWEINPKVLAYLAEKKLLFHQEEFKHSYPHCWRCETKLINYATSSWFVRVIAIKEELIKQNRKINWIPKHIKEGRFGEWLRGGRDWAISRSRYWGTPLPVWKCSNCENIEVMGSIKELEEKTKQKIQDLHKHLIDSHTWVCNACQQGKMNKVPEVLDCWFESGSMPYASIHYPFENKKYFAQHFPADFIGEGVDQTRGWFYTLHVLAVALFGKPAFKNVICTGLVLSEDGQKMSKSKKNYPDPLMILDKYGADAMRFYLVNSPVVQGEDLCFSEKELAEFFRNFNLLIWNSYAFFVTYANLHQYKLTKQIKKTNNILDKWLVSRLQETIDQIRNSMDKHEIYNATRFYQPFLNDLSRWYIRRSRERFNHGDKEALATLHYVLLEFTRLLAPFMPFLAEEIYQNLTGGNYNDKGNLGNFASVHLGDFPKASKRKINQSLHNQMKIIRKIAEVGNRKRREAGIKVRQPLASLSVVLSPDDFKLLEMEKKCLEEILKDELNIKQISWQIGAENLTEPVVDLDTFVTPELQVEGLTREIIRNIQRKRQQMGLALNERVLTTIEASLEIQGQIQQFIEHLARETSSTQVVFGKLESGEEVEINKNKIKIAVTKR